MNVNEATMKELVTFYNENAEKPVKRFSDRKTAMRRVDELIADMPEVFSAKRRPVAPAPVDELMANYGRTECPSCGISLDNGVMADGDETGNGGVLRTESRQYECMACGAEFGPVVHRHSSASHSEAIARSWLVAETHRKRCQRSAVLVDGVRYKSVRAAFVALGLPLKHHIGFRGDLKAAGTLDAYDRHWEVVPLNYKGGEA